MNRTNTRICWLRKPLHIANTGGHFFSFLSLIHIFSCTQRLITLSTPSWAQCHVLDLHSTPCTLHSHTQSKRRKKQRGHHSFKTFFLWFTSYQFPGFLLQCFMRILHFLCSWVSCKAILARYCSGPSRAIHYSAVPTAPF